MLESRLQEEQYITEYTRDTCIVWGTPPLEIHVLDHIELARDALPLYVHVLSVPEYTYTGATCKLTRSYRARDPLPLCYVYVLSRVLIYTIDIIYVYTYDSWI